MNRFTKWWLAWGAWFLAIEIAAIKARKRAPGGTLSSLVWRFSDRQHRYRRTVFIVGWLVLSGHLIWHWVDI